MGQFCPIDGILFALPEMAQILGHRPGGIFQADHGACAADGSEKPAWLLSFTGAVP